MCFEAIADWLDHLEALDYSEHTLRIYGGSMVRFCFWLARQHVPLEATTPAVLDAFLTTIGNHGPAKLHYALAWRSFFGFAIRRGFLESDPTEDVKPRPPPEPEIDPYPEEELVRLFLAAASRRTRLGKFRRMWAMVLCYEAGLRRAELCGIRPEDVGTKGVHVTGKGRKSRTVPLNSLAREAIEQLSPGANGTLLGVKPPTFTAWVNQAARDVGFPPGHRRAHLLRAAFASDLDDRGAPSRVIRDLLGHANIRTTDRYFGRSGERQREEAVGLLIRPGVE